MDDDLERKLQETIDAMPRIPGIDWSMTLAVAILRTLEDRFPGFTNDVQRLIERSAARMEASDSEDDRADAPDMRALLASWVFTDGKADKAAS